MSYELITSAFFLVVLAIWAVWLVAAFAGWVWSRRKARKLSGWDRVGAACSAGCLLVGLYFFSAELDRVSGALEFREKNGIGTSAVAERCHERSVSNVEKFQDCWQWHRDQVRKYKDAYWWNHLLFAPLVLLGLCWTPILIGGWLWRGFWQKSAVPGVVVRR